MEKIEDQNPKESADKNEAPKEEKNKNDDRTEEEPKNATEEEVPAKTWIDEMIEREAIPRNLREETTQEFCKRHKLPVSNYYYYASKKENWEKILELSLNSVKRETPEVLKTLGKRARQGDTKAIDMFLNYVVDLSKNLDITTKGKPLYLPSEIIEKYDSIPPSSEGDSKESEEV
jgi:hypothetical protein